MTEPAIPAPAPRPVPPALTRVPGLESLIEAIEQLHANRWEAHIPHDRNTLARFARSMPTSPDGITWTGATGWEGLDAGRYPQRGMHVAFVLFGNGNVPVHIGFTEQFRARVKTLAGQGVRWTSWLAQLSDTRQDAMEVRRELVKKYGEPNIAAQPNGDG